MKRLHWLLALGALAFAATTQATDPEGGTIDEQNTQQMASGGPYFVSNPSSTGVGEPTCSGSGQDCDEYLLTLDLSQGYRDANPNAVIVIDLISNGGDDLDMYIYDDQDNLIAQGATESASEVAIANVSDIPSTARVVIVPFTATGGTADLILTLGQGSGSGDGGGVDPCAVEDEANEGSALLDDAVRQDFTALGGSAIYGAFVHFNLGDTAYQDAILASRGLTVQKDFRKWSRAVYVFGPVSAFQALSLHPAVSRIEHNKPLRYFGDTAGWASRTRVAQEAVSGGPYFDAAGNVLDGSGITLGVIDGGLQGLHPDFGNILFNYRITGPDLVGAGFPEYVDVGPTSSEAPGGGHGTHVAGIVLGQGVQSDGGYPVAETTPYIEGTFTGVAPQARLVNWGNGLGLVVLSAASSYAHLLENEDSYDPPLRAVNNSYGDITPGTPYDPGSASSCLIKEIVNERGIVMAFAAGNDGGDGGEDMTSGQCKDPTPGVICVAMYDDLNTGERDGPLSSGSSRGESGKPETYPDIAAPGVAYTSTCIQGDPSNVLCGDSLEPQWQPWYGTISGTSMATPHVTGAIGLLLQARPDLTPAEVEEVLQLTARKVGDDYEPDPQLSGNTVNVGYGAGLLDFAAALDSLGVASAGLPPSGQETLVIDGDTDAGDATDVVSVSLQDATIGGQSGIQYRLTLADAGNLGGEDPIRYRIERNVAGKPAATEVLLGSSGPSIAEPGETNTSIASDVQLVGNVLSVFVDHLQQGTPAVGEPVHNIRVFVEGAGGVLDVAPSPAGSNDPLMPMYGLAFTSQLAPGALPPSNERSCELPGFTTLVSPPGTTFNGSGTGQEDIRQAWIAEPTGEDGKLYFTIQVDNLSPQPIPQHRWYYYFNVSGDDNDYWVAMDTLQGVPQFLYGTNDAIAVPALGGVGTFTVLGEIEPESNFTPEGLITLVLDKSVLGITNGTVIDGMAISVRQTSNPENGSGLTVDSAASQLKYTVVGNDTCVSPSGVTGVTNSVSSGAAPSSSGGGGALGVVSLFALLLCGWRRQGRS